MIKIFTIGKPDSRIKNLAGEIFSLPEGAFNLPMDSSPNPALFEKLYSLGAKQIICDGIPDEITCLDGYLYAQNLMNMADIPAEEVLRLKNTA